MLDGTYVGSVDTPMGKVSGKVSIATNGNTATGTLEVMGIKSDFTNGVVNGNMCTFKGSFKSMLGSIQYEVSGKLDGDILNITANTNKGQFILKGKRI